MTASAETLRDGLPLVTFVLVCWNHERYVRSAVLSALNQTYPNFQLIVIDNGSTDGSRRELQALQVERDFTLICQVNVGLVRALNQGLALAQGKYFATLATDDMWLPQKTAVQVRFLETHPDVDLVSGQVDSIDEAGRPLPRQGQERPGEATFVDLMTRGCFVYGPTIMCRVQTLRDMGGYDESMRIEDYALALRMTHGGRRVVVLADDLTLYRRHAASWTARSIDPELAEIGAKFRRTPEYPAFYRHHFSHVFYELVKSGEKKKALRHWWTEPVPWTWNHLGRGLLRMFVPYAAIRVYRRLCGKRPEGGARA